jgi:hypothetical protein
MRIDNNEPYYNKVEVRPRPRKLVFASVRQLEEQLYELKTPV